MKKLVLNVNMKDDIMEINKGRRDKYDYLYLSNEVIESVFNWFLSHKLTVKENAATYWYRNNKKQDESFGFSGISINERLKDYEMVSELAHEIFCAAEWLVRTTREGHNYAKQYYGIEFQNIYAL